MRDFYKYADDTELSQSAPPDESCSVQTGIQTCIGDVLSWMNSKQPMLNTDDTEIMAYLSETTSARLVTVLITSCLDYCNSALDGLPVNQTGRLQRVRNSAARLGLKKRKRDHITPLLNELHWLPVKFRCENNVATLAYRHFDGTLPSYFFGFSLHVSDFTHSPILEQETFQNPKRNFKSVGVRELAALCFPQQFALDSFY